jgi:hypothetical protein
VTFINQCTKGPRIEAWLIDPNGANSAEMLGFSAKALPMTRAPGKLM